MTMATGSFANGGAARANRDRAVRDTPAVPVRRSVRRVIMEVPKCPQISYGVLIDENLCLDHCREREIMPEIIMANEKGPNLKKKQKCKNCEGKGLLKKGDRVVKCQRCGGTWVR